MNYVTVYDRVGGAQLYISWVDDEGRHDTTIEALTGYVVTDRELATKIADDVAKAQERKANLRADEALFGYSAERTLGDLLERMHEVRGPEWSESYTRDQKRFRSFWEDRLGKDARLLRLSPARVESIVHEVGAEREWADATKYRYLRYLVDALYFAQKKLKWVDEKHNLSAVDFPSPDSESKAYTEAEIHRLLRALPDVDLRAAFVAEVAYATGRRLNAIRMLTPDDLALDHEPPLVRFPRGSDKARKRGEAVLTPQATEVAGKLLETPAVASTGWMCPAGELDERGADRRLSRKELIELLHVAEKRADPKVPYVEGRAYHGIKRRVASMAKDRRAMAKQSGTREETLRQVYEQDDLAPKEALAEFLASRREET